MAGFHRGETTTGPLAFDGRTLTLVARTTALHVGDDARGGLHIRSRPLHVEVLDENGQRQVVSVRDVEHILLVAIAIGTFASTYVLRAVRKNRKQRSS